MQELLATEYEQRDKTGITESEIDAVIYSYYASKKVVDQFKAIESRLPETDADVIRRETDSMINVIEKLKKEMKAGSD